MSEALDLSHGLNFAHPLRPWQARMLPVAQAAIESNAGTGLGVLAMAATGAGKTLFTAELIQRTLADLRPDEFVVVSVPSSDLARQTRRNLMAMLGVPVGRLGGGGPGIPSRVDLDSRVVVTTSLSFGRLWDARVACGEGMLATVAPPMTIGLLVVDEAHLHPSAIERGLDTFGPPRLWFGLTATPFRMSGRHMQWPEEYHPELAFSYNTLQAIREGAVLKPRGHMWTQEDRLPAVLAPLAEDHALWPEGAVDTKEDWANKDAHAMVYALRALAMYLERPTPGPGLISAPDVYWAHRIAALWEKFAGFKVLVVTGQTSPVDRAKAVASLLAGDAGAICHIDTWTEGSDLPALRWLAGRKREAKNRIIQEMGRVLRRLHEPDRWGPKTVPVVYFPVYVPVADFLRLDGDVLRYSQDDAETMAEILGQDLPDVETLGDPEDAGPVFTDAKAGASTVLARLEAHLDALEEATLAPMFLARTSYILKLSPETLAGEPSKAVWRNWDAALDAYVRVRHRSHPVRWSRGQFPVVLAKGMSMTYRERVMATDILRHLVALDKRGWEHLDANLWDRLRPA